jgi:hypothetical protein
MDMIRVESTNPVVAGRKSKDVNSRMSRLCPPARQELRSGPAAHGLTMNTAFLNHHRF